jgi:hypothetical protein
MKHTSSLTVRAFLSHSHGPVAEGSTSESPPCCRINFRLLVQLCTSSFLRTFILMMKRLYILDDGMPFSYRLNDVEGNQWLDLLRQ